MFWGILDISTPDFFFFFLFEGVCSCGSRVFLCEVKVFLVDSSRQYNSKYLNPGLCS